MAGSPLRLTRSRPLLILLALAGLATLVWLGWNLGQQWRHPQATARPALWQISRGGTIAYLFGTIHAVPRGKPWLSPRIEQAMKRSDRLILEVTGLDAERRSRAIFDRLGRSPDLPPIEFRLALADAAHYRALAERHAAAFHGLSAYESWAAALLINAAAASDLALSSAEAGESVLTDFFTQARKPIRGLETIQQQLGLFDTLSEVDQRLLLTQSVREADDAPHLYADLYRAWATGDLPRLERQFLAPLASVPTLRRVIIDNRNQRWSRIIDADLRREGGTAFIAVGAGHLLGPRSVQARLAALGWHVERVQ